MNMRLGIAGMVGFCVSCELVVGAAIVLGASGGCVVRGGIDARLPGLVVGTDADSSGASSGPEDSHDTRPAHKHQITTTGSPPTNDIEEIAVRKGVRAASEELDRMQERCGFTIPVEIMYAAPMKTWVGAEGWGNHRGCTNEAESGGCINLSVCGSEIVESFWFNLCGDPGEGVKKAYRGWNTKVKKLICRGEPSPPDTSAMDHEHSRMSASLSKDGILTVTLHPSDANVSYDFANYLAPRIEAD